MSDQPNDPPPCQCLTCRTDCTRPHTQRVCTGCRRRLDTWLADLPDQYRALGTWLEPAGGHSEHVSGSRTPPLPVRLAALNLRSKGGIITIMHSWLCDWHQLQGWNPPQLRAHHPDIGASLLTTITDRLRDQLDWACDHHDYINEFAAELAQHRATIRGVLQDWSGDVHLPVPCPNPTCDMLGLVLADGAVYVECQACGVMWTETELARLGLVLTAAGNG